MAQGRTAVSKTASLDAQRVAESDSPGNSSRSSASCGQGSISGLHSQLVNALFDETLTYAVLRRQSTYTEGTER